VRHNNTNINVLDWVDYLTYFNIINHKKCIESLLNYDTVGVNLHIDEEHHTSYTPTHYFR
jgi:hypothetical protein